jgi:hypothetical protein
VISDAQQSLKDAVAAVLDGAAWQRCRTFMRNLLLKVLHGLVAAYVQDPTQVAVGNETDRGCWSGPCWPLGRA